MPNNHPPRTPLAWIPYLWQTVLFPAHADSATSVRWRSLALIVALSSLLLYPTRSFHLLEPDEGRYAQIPKEMLTTGQYLVPTLQGEPYLDKPPLMYWLVALSYRMFGVNESSARLVPALCVQLTILSVYLLGRRSLGERAACWAAILLSVAPGFLSIARLLLLDGLLTLCVTVSVLCGFEAVRNGVLNRRWWYLSALASGLGFLTKGPISEILLFPPLLAFAWLTANPARVRLRDLVGFAMVVIGINLPWYIGIYLHQPVFLKYFFWEHNVMRFVQPFDHLQPVWYYAPILLGGLLPGTVFIGIYIRSLLVGGVDAARVRSAAGGFWLLAGLWCVAFFSVSGSKLPTYILPAYPFLMLALGEFLAGSRWNTHWFPRTSVLTFASLLFVFHSFVLPKYAEQRSPYGQPEFVAKYLSEPELPVVTYPRNVDSLAFYFDRADFDRVRSKDVNQLMVDMHHRPRTVILFTHRHSFEAFQYAMPESLRVAEHVTLKRPVNSFWGKLVGDTPWGLADIAVIVPSAVARAQQRE
jgi:4-amino-4-deoxy-L-arabinose transferase-like glycosyltransferase